MPLLGPVTTPANSAEATSGLSRAPVAAAESSEGKFESLLRIGVPAGCASCRSFRRWFLSLFNARRLAADTRAGEDESELLLA